MVVVVVSNIFDFPPDKLQILVESEANVNSNTMSSPQLHTTQPLLDRNDESNMNEDLPDKAFEKDQPHLTLLKKIIHSRPRTSDDMLWMVAGRLGSSIAKQVSYPSNDTLHSSSTNSL